MQEIKPGAFVRIATLNDTPYGGTYARVLFHLENDLWVCEDTIAGNRRQFHEIQLVVIEEREYLDQQVEAARTNIVRAQDVLDAALKARREYYNRENQMERSDG